MRVELSDEYTVSRKLDEEEELLISVTYFEEDDYLCLSLIFDEEEEISFRIYDVEDFLWFLGAIINAVVDVRGTIRKVSGDE